MTVVGKQLLANFVELIMITDVIQKLVDRVDLTEERSSRAPWKKS